MIIRSYFSALIWGVAAITMIALTNLIYYQSIESAFMYKHIVNESDFNQPPDKAGRVESYDMPFAEFSYRPALRMSKSTFDTFYGDVLLTENIIENTISVAKKTRSFFMHAQHGFVYPFIPDQTISIASKRPVVCGTYARTVLAALDYLGYSGRIIYLAGHVTLEVFDTELDQWVYIDPNWAVYFTDNSGKYLSVTQLQNQIAKNDDYIPHSYDITPDDPIFLSNPEDSQLASRIPELTVTNQTLIERFTNGYTAFEDGLGYTYRRKGLLHTFKPVHIVYLENNQLPIKIKLGGIRNLLLLNGALLVIAFILFPKRSKSA